jgi:hypothetical protein
MQVGKGARRCTYKKTMGLEAHLALEQVEHAARLVVQCAGGVVHAGTVEAACRGLTWMTFAVTCPLRGVLL